MAKPKLRFEVYAGRGGDHRFRVLAANNKIVASGEGYKNRADAVKTCNLIRGHALTAPIEYADVTPAAAIKANGNK